MMTQKSINRRTFLQVSTASALAVTAGLHCQKTLRRPNILFIMSDDHAYQALSCYNGQLNETRQIDRIAQEGVRFEQSFCTNSICAPSRATLLTGKYSHMNGQIDNSVRFDGSQVTFPKLLQAAGYQTALIGKWHLKSDPTGFDYWNILPDQGSYYNPDFIEMGMQSRRTGYVTDLTTDYALNWLKARKPDQPFCLLLHHKAPHRNWMPPTRYLPLLHFRQFPVPDNFFDAYATRSDAARQQEMEIGRHMMLQYDLKMPPLQENAQSAQGRRDQDYWRNDYERMTPEQRQAWDAGYQPVIEEFQTRKPQGRELALWKYQRYMEDYIATVTAVDENVGRVLDYLDDSGLTDDTLVVYTSDNGFYLGEHGWFDKRFMYEESLRIPVLMRYPREIQATVNRDDIMLNIDFAPTFLDYAGLHAPVGMQGQSLRGILSGHTPKDWRQSMYYHYYEYPGWHAVKRHYGVRTRRYKLIHFYHDIDAWELYDLRKDPHEMNNVYGNPDYQSVIPELKAELKRLQEFYQDTLS